MTSNEVSNSCQGNLKNGKRNSKNSQTFLNDKERELIFYLYENKLATAYQIQRDIFPLTHYTNVFRRLQKLVSAGVVRKIYLRTEYKMHAYSLTKPSFRKYILDDVKEIRRQHLSNSPEHDVSLVDVKHRLSKSDRVKSYLTENIIKSKRNALNFSFIDLYEMNSDAGLIIQGKDKEYLIALEYESSQKAQTRYEKKISGYYNRTDINSVIYICSSEKIMNAIKLCENLKRPERKAKIFYSLKESVQDETIELNFINLKNQRLVLR